jgi:hypothetical protein
VNRILRRFREDGLAAVAKGRVKMLNLEKLVELAYPLFDVFEREAPEYPNPKLRLA